jgi:hypothetical protein
MRLGAALARLVIAPMSVQALAACIRAGQHQF